MSNLISRADLLKHIRQRIDNEYGGHITSAARAWSTKGKNGKIIYPQHLSAILRNDMKPFKHLVKKLGFEPVEAYAYKIVDKHKKGDIVEGQSTK